MLVAPSFVAARPGGGQSYRGSEPPSSGSGSSHDDKPFGGGSSFGDSTSRSSPASPSHSWERSSPSSSSSSGSSGSSGSSSEGDPWILAAIGIGLVVVGVACYVRHLIVGQQWSTDPSDVVLTSHAPAAAPAPLALGWELVARDDPDASPILVQDFLHELFTRLQQARADADAMARLAPFVAPEVRAHLLAGAGELREVTGIIVGSTALVDLAERHTCFELAVEFDACFTERHDDRELAGVFVREHWTLVRNRGARTQAPAELLAFNCPACGGAVEAEHPEICRQCGHRHAQADLTWRLVRVRPLARELRPPTLTEYAPEVGTELPTRRQPDVSRALASLQIADPAFEPAALAQRVALIHRTLNDAWSSLAWERAHPFLSDRLWSSMRYWIEAYRAQGLRNLMHDAGIEQQVIAKVTADRHYRAIVVRVFASAIDTTVRVSDGTRVCGSPGPRRYSEYWTLVRSAARTGPVGTKPECPNCSAPISVGMAGTCDHCGVKVTSGAFDWVLAQIDQDEAYRG
ncbi:MAG: TIM44-like domain-containing protein [Deltaproteobacteria bacterium]|nr:TIM44-like domain-containing protein [Nannocystaceae bacterium]